jgi:hypothetical protein
MKIINLILVCILCLFPLLTNGQNIENLGKKEIRELYIKCTATVDSLNLLLTENLAKQKTLQAHLFEKSIELTKSNSLAIQYTEELKLLKERIQSLQDELLNLNSQLIKLNSIAKEPTFKDFSEGFKVDSVFENVAINGGMFTIMVLRDKLDENMHAFLDEDEPYFSQSPITIAIAKTGNKNPMYIKRFDFEPGIYPNFSYHFFKGQNQSLNTPGKLYLTFTKNFGGSGHTGINYFIDFKEGQINLKNIFSFGTLSYEAFSKTDNEILLLNGIWGEEETHFSSHRYKIIKYKYNNDFFEEIEIGETKFKYSSLDDDKSVKQIMVEIKAKEPLLLQSIKISDY